MGIHHIEGVMGAGKTCLLNWWAWKFRNAHLYVNYDLEFKDLEGKPIKDKSMPAIKRLERLTDLSRLKTRPNVCLGDELWASMDSYTSGALIKRAARGMLQSRKTDTEVISTIQDMMQMSARVRRVSGYVYQPKIILKNPETKMPYLLQVNWYNCQNVRENGVFTASMLVENEKGRVCVLPNSYNTREVVDEYESEEASGINDLIDKYLRYKGQFKIKQFANLIEIDEEKAGNHLTQHTARKIAEYIEYHAKE